MNNIILGAVGMVVIIAATMYAGYTLGLRNSAVSVEVSPLVITSCIDISAFSPTDKTFGATTKAMINLAGQYRACRTACLAQ